MPSHEPNFNTEGGEGVMRDDLQEINVIDKDNTPKPFYDWLETVTSKEKGKSFFNWLDN